MSIGSQLPERSDVVSSWGFVIEQLMHEDEAERVARSRRAAGRRRGRRSWMWWRAVKPARPNAAAPVTPGPVRRRPEPRLGHR